jgi:addiction module HigA family antidote
MHNPPHPGAIIKALCLDPLDVSVTQAARALGVSHRTLSTILNGRAGISPEMAVRLSVAFDTSAESWLNQQTQYDPWHAERDGSDRPIVRSRHDLVLSLHACRSASGASKRSASASKRV